MRSVLRQTTRSLARKRLPTYTHTHVLPITPQAVQAARNSRREAAPARPSATRTSRRTVSSSTPSAVENASEHGDVIVSSSGGDPPPEVPPEEPPEEGPVEEGVLEALEGQDKPTDGERIRRPRKPKADPDSVPPPLPEELNVLWTPETMDAPSPSALPPPEIMDKILTDLHVSLHPQSQHRAAYSSPASGSPAEPTLALYCPFEGGDYVVDETVKELARRTDSEVIVLDAVQIAAGESGCFGKGKNFHPNNTYAVESQ